MSEDNYTWTPRWYYILKNKTSGKKYIGQTVRANMDKYCGSGGYWTAHCKKHGGWDRTNIEVVWREWFVCEDTAKNFLKSFEERNLGYYSLACTYWANQVPENTEDNPFLGNKGQTKETSASIAKMAKKMKGRTKETHESIARGAEKRRGRTKENNEGVAKMAKKMKGRTKETHEGVARQAKFLSKIQKGQTKETSAKCAKQGKKISNKLWVNNSIVSKRIDKDILLPEGFVLGRLKKAYTRAKPLNPPVMCIETGEKFYTRTQIADWLKLQGRQKTEGKTAVLCAQGLRKHAYNFTWKFA